MFKPFDQNKIEAYLMDKLNPNEKIAFEELLEQDPILQSEFQLQQEILRAIQSQRKHELKARLGQLSVPSSPKASLGRALILGTMLLLGSSAYWVYTQWYLQEPNPQTVPSLVQTSPSHELMPEPPPNSETAILAEPLMEEAVTEKEVVEKVAVQETLQALSHEYPKSAKSIKSKKLAVNPKPVIIERNINDPEKADAKAGTIRTAFKTELVLDDPEEQELVKGIFDGSNKPNLEDIAQKNQNRLRYQYYNNELFLYNSNSAGRTFRIKQNEEERVYLYYNENYYLLHEPQIQSKDLKPIQDISLIRQLDQIRIQIYGN